MLATNAALGTRDAAFSFPPVRLDHTSHANPRGAIPRPRPSIRGQCIPDGDPAGPKANVRAMFEMKAYADRAAAANLFSAAVA
jgi:hypothetical protein